MKKIYLIAISLLIIPPAFAADNIVHGGAIARSPALVVAAGSIRSRLLGSNIHATYAKSALERRGYKIFMNRTIVGNNSNDAAIRQGLEHSVVFFFSGHGNKVEISNGILREEDEERWVIGANDFLTGINVSADQYRLVFLDACETMSWSNWTGAFKINSSSSGQVILGWSRELPELGWYYGRRGYDNTSWMRRFWYLLKTGENVKQAIIYAEDIGKTKSVADEWGLEYPGDLSVKLSK